MTTKKAGPRTSPNGRGRADPGEVRDLEREAAVPLADVVEDAEREAQARYEGVEIGDAISFYGQKYRLAPKIGYMPLLDFAHEANKGSNTEDPAALDAMRELLWRCFILAPPCRRCEICRGTEGGPCEDPDEDGNRCGLCEPCRSFVTPDPESCASYDPGDWPAFHLAALDHAADAEDLFDVVRQVMTAVTARPTRRRSGSQQPAPNGSPRSKERSSSRRAPPGAEDLVTIDELVR